MIIEILVILAIMIMIRMYVKGTKCKLPIPDFKNKIIIVTGSNSGIGL